MIKTLIVDDQVILRESLKFIIEQDSDIEVIGCAGDGFEALELCRKFLPDVVLMDIIMPKCNGIEAAKLIKEKYNNRIKIIILTTFSDDDNIYNAMEKGADGYILKDIEPKELILAIKSAAHGLAIFHREAMDVVMNKTKVISSQDNLHKENSVIQFTERERSIVKLIIDGKNNKEIASCLYISEGTVKNIITMILAKYKLRDRTQLAVFAIKNNME